MTEPFTFNEDEKYLLELDAKIARAARLKLERYILRILSECYPCSEAAVKMMDEIADG